MRNLLGMTEFVTAKEGTRIAFDVRGLMECDF